MRCGDQKLVIRPKLRFLIQCRSFDPIQGSIACPMHSSGAPRSLLALLVLAISFACLEGLRSTQSLNTLVSLKSIDITSTYKLNQKGNVKELDCVFLGRPNLDVISDEKGSGSVVTVCDLVPLLISRPVFTNKDLWSETTLTPNPVVNRDGGVYDSIPYSWGVRIDEEDDLLPLRAQEVKKQVFDMCSICKGNPGVAFLAALKNVLDIEVTGLFIEVMDEYGGDKGGIVLGAGAVVARNGQGEQYRMPRGNVRTSKDLRALPSFQPFTDSIKAQERLVQRLEADREGEVGTVICHLDEVVGLSRTLGLPIMAPQGLVERVCEDGVLTNEPMRLTAPARFRQHEEDEDEDEDEEIDEDIEKVWTIYNPLEFLSMSQVQKRDLLRASGVRSLPRPREGVVALDAVLADLMDAAVRREFTRLSADLEAAAKHTGKTNMNSLRTADVQEDGVDRASLLRRMGKALDEGDVELATKLREEFAFKTSLRADPTQEQGAYDPYLDQDEWYMENRRKAMAPKTKN